MIYQIQNVPLVLKLFEYKLHISIFGCIFCLSLCHLRDSVEWICNFTFPLFRLSPFLLISFVWGWGDIFPPRRPEQFVFSPSLQKRTYSWLIDNWRKKSFWSSRFSVFLEISFVWGDDIFPGGQCAVKSDPLLLLLWKVFFFKFKKFCLRWRSVGKARSNRCCWKW